jgi:hypothetical protein
MSRVRFFQYPEVADDVDVEDSFDLLRVVVENGVDRHDARVVYNQPHHSNLIKKKKKK